MILTDYFRSKHDITWDYALQCGVKHGTIRLPEENAFDITDKSHWQTVYDGFTSYGITPIIIEPMPNALHDHIKTGDGLRDESIEKVIKMLRIMDELDVRTICFNFMAHIGWLRTDSRAHERGGALVTGFNIDDFEPWKEQISEEALWENYEYFIRAVMPYAEKYNIRLALHPDDPPLEKLGNVHRIMISYENISRAVNGIVKSDNLGVTFCQATYHMMGENIYELVRKMADKIFFVHFRNTRGHKLKFYETFHDNGEIDMKKMISLYKEYTPDVPIRVDHVPQLAGETAGNVGYTALGRLYAIGYLKGLME